jgi:hypothetical protein
MRVFQDLRLSSSTCMRPQNDSITALSYGHPIAPGVLASQKLQIYAPQTLTSGCRVLRCPTPCVRVERFVRVDQPPDGCERRRRREHLRAPLGTRPSPATRLGRRRQETRCDGGLNENGNAAFTRTYANGKLSPTASRSSLKFEYGYFWNLTPAAISVPHTSDGPLATRRVAYARLNSLRQPSVGHRRALAAVSLRC